jgi:TPR repeat protein
VARDNRAAVRWCRKAAEQGLAKAQYYLGLQYGGGYSMVRDEVTAYKWYSLAAAQGYEGARTLRDAVASAISTKQIAQVQ